jgi:hypothetical protein
MNSQHEQFLNLKTLPARVRVEEAALLLGFSVREMPILASNGLLKPLGRPPLTGVKYYAVSILEELRRNEKWLARASDCIVEYWQNVNQKRKPARDDQSQAAPRNRNNLKRQSLPSEPRSSRHFENAAE